MADFPNTLDVADQATSITAADHGLMAWSGDVFATSGGVLLTNGTQYLVKVRVRRRGLASKIYWHVTTNGATPTSGQNEVGLFNSSGTRLAAVNVDADISSTGTKATALAATLTLDAGDYWVGLVFNASTAPSLARGPAITGAATLLNVGLAAAAYRFATNGTSKTALDASITPANNVAGSAVWAGIGP